MNTILARCPLALVLAGFALVQGGCTGAPGSDPITIGATGALATRSLDDAISTLERESGAWRTELGRLQEQLTNDAQQTLRNEVAGLMREAIAASGAEVRCNADFIGVRVKEQLMVLRAKITGRTPPPLEPVACQVNPPVITRGAGVGAVQVAGWNLRPGTVAADLVSEGGRAASITDKLAFPTQYLMTVDLGSAGVQLKRDSRKLVFKSAEGRIFSDPAIIQPPEKARQLTFTFVNGDGARSGHRILAAVHRQSGRPLKLEHGFDGGAEWPNDSTRTVTWNLPQEVVIDEITSIDIDFEDGDCFACRGDDWNIKRLKVEVSLPEEARVVLVDDMAFGFHMRGVFSAAVSR